MTTLRVNGSRIQLSSVFSSSRRGVHFYDNYQADYVHAYVCVGHHVMSPDGHIIFIDFVTAFIIVDWRPPGRREKSSRPTARIPGTRVDVVAIHTTGGTENTESTDEPSERINGYNL